jgi:acetoin utilization deacetylase AcuC-like enzyme
MAHTMLPTRLPAHLPTVIAHDPIHKRHTREGHPENYRRVEESWSLLQVDGILPKLRHLPSTPAPVDAILRVHNRAYLERLEASTHQEKSNLDADTYLTESSYQAALLGAGGLLNIVDAVMQGQAKNGFSLARPPGHHALPHWGMGFCLLANVSIAARWAQDNYDVGRVLIVDFDVHHGNGTQDVFYRDPSVLFFSTHQFPFYPGTGAAYETGEGRAEGATINVPLPSGVGDQGYLTVFQRLLYPAARLFRPELILVSAGYDAHWLDPLANMRLSVTGYTNLLQSLMALADELCDGRLVVALEGGYHIGALSHSVLSAIRLLSHSHQGPSDPFGMAPGGERDISPLLEKLRNIHHIPDEPYYSLGG